ncbi:CaiB/BaiF CoA-transferase family protein [soil metagenome]
MPGPLHGVRVVELAGLGPAPFASMLLSDLGAEVIRVDRVKDVVEHGAEPPPDIIGRGRRSIAVDLKSDLGRQVVLDLVSNCDVLVEGFRPGVTERLGLGPAECMAVNPRLIYGRMTGWGQDGPLARTAGHDLGYIAITGALDGSRRRGQLPTPPMNLLGDLGGGALYLVVGLLAALWESGRSGAGQVIDAAIVDGTAHLTNFVLGLRSMGVWTEPPGGNTLDTGAPFYDVYTCADGKELVIAALEPQFYAELVRLTGATDPSLAPERRLDPANWPAGRERWRALFVTRTRDEWTQLLQHTDACIAPVLSMDEAPTHPQLSARATFVDVDGLTQAAPAPRFSRTGAELDRPPAWAGQHTDEVLAELGRTEAEIRAARQSGAVG